MTLSCLACGPVLERTNSDKKKRFEDKMRSRMCCGVDRSWSGNLGPPPAYESIRSGSALVAAKKVGTAHRRLHSTGDEPPKLKRSGGMRRDWSFEDLRQRRDEKRMLIHKP